MKLEINVRAVLGVLLLLLASCVPLMSQYLYHHSGEWLHSADRESFGVNIAVFFATVSVTTYLSTTSPRS